MVRDVRLSISVTKEVSDILEKISGERGIQKSKLVEAIILEWLYRRGYRKIEHFNFRDNTISLWDFLLEKLVDIRYDLERKALICVYCKDVMCGHIYSALNIEEIKKKINQLEKAGLLERVEDIEG